MKVKAKGSVFIHETFSAKYMGKYEILLDGTSFETPPFFLLLFFFFRKKK
jgi:hypothetical protein